MRGVWCVGASLGYGGGEKSVVGVMFERFVMECSLE